MLPPVLLSRTLLPVLCLLAVVVPASAAAAAAPVVGMGEQKDSMFADRNFKKLGLRHVRYIAPWDVLRDPVQLAKLDAWMVGARLSNARVVLGFAHSLRTEKLARTLPSARRFAREFAGVRKRYPTVKDWIPWNEANHPGALTEKRPGRAAQFYDAIVRQCRKCNVAAADVLDVRNMPGWVRKFKRYVRHKPKIWGLHNYADANKLRPNGLYTLMRVTRGKIWMTETGGLVLRREFDGRRATRTIRYSLAHQSRATRYILRLACRTRRVQRVYLYHWQSAKPVTNWDSGFINQYGKARPAYRMLKKSVVRKSSRARCGR
jgi:hypothetical protein